MTPVEVEGYLNKLKENFVFKILNAVSISENINIIIKVIGFQPGRKLNDLEMEEILIELNKLY